MKHTCPSFYSLSTFKGLLDSIKYLNYPLQSNSTLADICTVDGELIRVTENHVLKVWPTQRIQLNETVQEHPETNAMCPRNKR